MKRLLLLLALCNIFVNAQAQQQEEGCATIMPPIELRAWYGNPSVLKSFRTYTEQLQDNSAQRTYVTYDLNEVTYNIPVRVYVYASTTGFSEHLEAHRVEALINRMNQYLKDDDIPINLYLTPESLQIIGDNSRYRATPVTWGALNRSPRNSSDYVDIHISYTNGGNDLGPFGVAVAPPTRAGTTDTYYNLSLISAAPIDGTIRELEFNFIANVAVHELGHIFSLDHTYQGTENLIGSTCLAEPVSRTRLAPQFNESGNSCIHYNSVGSAGVTANPILCTVTGDLMCQTEADPRVPSDIVNCTDYVGGQTDAYGDVWTPPSTNFMTDVQDRLCRTDFVPEQKQAMYMHIENRYYRRDINQNILSEPNDPKFYRNHFIDAYENDNYWQNAKEINPSGGSTAMQLRTFHTDLRALQASPEIDWVKFEVNGISPSDPTRKIFIATKPLYRVPEPDQIGFFLYREDAGTLVHVDEWNSTAATSERELDLETDKTYYLKIRNVTPLSNNLTIPPHYHLGVFEDMNLFDLFGTGSNVGIGGNLGNPTGLGVLGSGFAGSLNGGLSGVVCDGDRLTFNLSPNAPSGLTFNWSVVASDPGLSLSLTPFGSPDSQATANFSGSGEATVRVQILQAGTVIYESNEDFWFGTPAGGTLSPSRSDKVFCSPELNPTLGYYEVLGANGATRYTWEVNGRVVLIGNISYLNAALLANNYLALAAFREGVNHLRVTVSNACGVGEVLNDQFTILKDADCIARGPRLAEGERAEKETTSTLTFFPNPTKDVIRIILDERFIGQEMLISVYNAQGQFVNAGISVGETQAKIDLKSLSSGIYFVELGGATAYEQLKVIKQ